MPRRAGVRLDARCHFASWPICDSIYHNRRVRDIRDIEDTETPNQMAGSRLKRVTIESYQ
jgi:hypothetical protein